jgi:carbonic anhydrase
MEAQPSAQEAIERLKAGNLRFVSGDRTASEHVDARWRASLVASQRPFAAILGCSDSRVPAEIIFDQGLGDLFVVRVAGNIAGPSQIGSIEFAVTQFGVPLVVVLGHALCGAVQATVDELRDPSPELSPYLRSIVNAIRPAVEPLLSEDPRPEVEVFTRRAVRENVRRSVERLRRRSRIVERLAASSELLLVGAEYSLESGAVAFLDEMPQLA